MPKATHTKQENTRFALRYNPLSPSFVPTMEAKGLLLMQKMGYKIGSGLGKNQQGILDSIHINGNVGKEGLGFEKNDDDNNYWDADKENDNVKVEDKIEWLENNDHNKLLEPMENWLIEQNCPNHNVLENYLFCDKDILKNVFDGKNIFDKLNLDDLYKARNRANSFESVRSAFFMNRAALKMANIDAASDFMFTNVENNCNFSTDKNPIYFADVCAGPGGFSEYILWRKQWHYKGFGFTLKNDSDFNISASSCASPATFQSLYGENDDGNVYKSKNIQDFTRRVRHETDTKGVHFMMSDGGFSVDGNENLQEMLSKRIYLCQCLVALEILRPHGYFVTKLFDIFTSFSIGLLYLMYLCFEKIAIIKPVTSRPANSERYFVCYNFLINNRTRKIRKYIWKIVKRFEDVECTQRKREIVEIVPLETIKMNQSFFNYIVSSNNRIGQKQIIALKKLAHFAKNPSLIDERQIQLRTDCLNYWKIPGNIKRTPLTLSTADEIIRRLNIDDVILNYTGPQQYLNSTECFITDFQNFHYCFTYSTPNICRCHFFVAIENSKVYKLQNNKWKSIKKIYLSPGTVLYGEFVKEQFLSTEHCDKIQYRHSLHVIDALYLGSENIQGENYKKRIELINLYCKSVNRESQKKQSIRIRPKEFHELIHLPQDSQLEPSKSNCKLIKIGYKTKEESYEVNSVLIKKKSDHSFLPQHILSIPILADNVAEINLDTLNTFIKNKLQTNY